MVIILMAAVAVFVIGLAFSIGYSGTTALRPLDGQDSFDQDLWGKFLVLFSNYDLSSTPTKGVNPYLFQTQAQLQAKKNGQIINFDRRLIRTLNYIALQQDSPKECGWSTILGVNPRHERIKVEVASAKEGSQSDLSPQPSSSASTLGRGTGARFSESGYMRCSWFYDRKQCPNEPLSDDRWHVYGQYKILLNNQASPFKIDEKMIPPKLPYGVSAPSPIFNPVCSTQIKCAVDYFPSPGTQIQEGSDLSGLRTFGLVLPTGESLLSKYDSLAISSLNPNVFGATPPQTSPESLSVANFEKDKPQLSVAYKAAQLALELLTIDNAGCEKPTANIENQRNIPYTIIFPKWIADIMDKNGVWSNFINIAKSSAGFPYNLQVESPLAGLSFDSALDSIGLHFNY